MNDTHSAIDADGTKHWYLNGILSRADGPAVEYANGDRRWYINGLLHRSDGPAIEYAYDMKFWYLNGKKFSFNEFVIEAKWSDADLIMWKLSAS